MAVFDITDLVINFRRQSIYDRSGPKLGDIIDWLKDNVGEFYGPGDGVVSKIGSGWEILRFYNGKPIEPAYHEDAVVTWHVDITDEAKSTLFALKWIR